MTFPGAAAPRSRNKQDQQLRPPFNPGGVLTLALVGPSYPQAGGPKGQPVFL
jgi:hypothetical protein